MKRKAARLSRQQVGTSGEDNAQNFARSASKPQDSHGPRATNHHRNIGRHNKCKAARTSSQAQKKTHIMSSGRADNRVQLLTKKASKSSGMGIYHAGYTALPEEKVNTHFRDEQHKCWANFARKKTHVTSSGEADNQDKLSKKKVDKPSGMETYYSGYTNISDERVRKLIRDELRLTALGQCTLSNWFQSASNPTSGIYYAGSTVLPTT
ncbi:hypothetical protein THAOC_26465 [Thalassiosira oceanica]|uniref:Uncharacterized protein n=1 Tax=Thalassiosira oceanica TaxID=159749 RepID=K0RJU9_THAOC|nr:hypothetical protein THAOC_26465 [Thalassiosira oceanica]|eukprot:EJK53993.1 hypothetical protein THAOC_26465 [Thalassiosira oceanica]